MQSEQKGKIPIIPQEPPDKTLVIIGGGFASPYLFKEQVDHVPENTHIVIFEPNGEERIGISPPWLEDREVGFASVVNGRLNATTLCGGGNVAERAHSDLKKLGFTKGAANQWEIVPRLPRRIIGGYNHSDFKKIMETAASRKIKVSIISEAVENFHEHEGRFQLVTSSGPAKTKEGQLVIADDISFCIGPPEASLPQFEKTKKSLDPTTPLKRDEIETKGLPYPVYPLTKLLEAVRKSYTALDSPAEHIVFGYGAGAQMIDAFQALQDDKYPGKLVVTSRRGKIPVIGKAPSDRSLICFTPLGIEKFQKERNISSFTFGDFHDLLEEECAHQLTSDRKDFKTDFKQWWEEEVNDESPQTEKKIFERMERQIKEASDAKGFLPFITMALSEVGTLEPLVQSMEPSEREKFDKTFRPILHRHHSPLRAVVAQRMIEAYKDGHFSIKPHIEDADFEKKEAYFLKGETLHYDFPINTSRGSHFYTPPIVDNLLKSEKPLIKYDPRTGQILPQDDRIHVIGSRAHPYFRGNFAFPRDAQAAVHDMMDVHFPQQRSHFSLPNRSNSSPQLSPPPNRSR